jgi:hypothetical protein
VEEAEDAVEKKEALEETVGRVASKEGAAVLVEAEGNGTEVE